MSSIQKEFGRHYLIELVGCDPERIKFVKDVEDVFLTAAKASQATVLESYYHQFKPHGVSGMIFIAESHFSIHTWPQDMYAGVDILTCGQMYPQRAISVLEKEFRASEARVQIITRGF